MGSSQQKIDFPSAYNIKDAVRKINDDDWQIFNKLSSIELNETEKELAAHPDRMAPEAKEYMAVHWHPEWAPLELIRKRLDIAFPNAENYLCIPTQHNKILTFGPWAGVEVDVYDRRYGLKVQLLIHFKADKMSQAGVLSDMIERTYNYRAHQLLDILDALAEPDSVKINAGLKASVHDESVLMVSFYAVRLRALIEKSGIKESERSEMLKNRLLPDFLQARLAGQNQRLLDQALIYIEAVKKEIKKKLSPESFFSPEEMIEEARLLNAGIVIPHPPSFWPILLADLDVDGWEVWNPSTPKHSIFLLEALERTNQTRKTRKKLLPFMGDDTHMSSKFRRSKNDMTVFIQREIGFQDPWDDPLIRSLLKNTAQSREKTLNEYRQRIS